MKIKRKWSGYNPESELLDCEFDALSCQEIRELKSQYAQPGHDFEDDTKAEPNAHIKEYRLQPIDVAWVYEYGLQQKLSNSIRVF